jgi:hypothetical protein
MDVASQQAIAMAREVASPPAPRWEWAVSWAFAGGAVCSGVLHWPLGANLTWVVLWFLADPVTGAVANALAALGWAYRALGSPSIPQPVWKLPYARPGSPSERLVSVGELLTQEWHHAGRAVLLGIVAIVIGLLLALTRRDAFLSTTWAAAMGMTILAALLPEDLSPPLTLAVRAFGAWLMGFAAPDGITTDLLVVAGLASCGLAAVSLAEQGRTHSARWIGRLAAWGLVTWLAMSHQPVLVAWTAALALYWEAVMRTDRGAALAAWRLAWLAMMMLSATSFRFGAGSV